MSTAFYWSNVSCKTQHRYLVGRHSFHRYAPINYLYISGGGIGGLALALALSKYPDIRVDVYEAAKEFDEIGAGIMMWERTWRILQTLGLAEDLSKAANTPPNGLPGSYRCFCKCTVYHT